MVTQNGDLTASVQSLVEVEYKQEPELAPIPHLPTEERTAVAWDPVHQPENATMMHAIMVKNNYFTLAIRVIQLDFNPRKYKQSQTPAVVQGE